MNVENFMKQLSAQTAPVQKSGTFKPKERTLEKISLNFEGHFGMYQVLPVNSLIHDYPFVKLFGTREICVPRKNTAQDGTESTYTAWIKLLPKDAYQFLDLNGRVTSSLTAEEDQLLSEAYTVFDQLYNEIDARNNINISRDLLRKRNYTIFNAYCCNFWGVNKDTGKVDIRNPQRSKFSGLFVSTAKGFINAVEEDINTTSIDSGGGLQWLEQIYSRQASGRTGYMNFTIGRNTSIGMGYTVNVTHKHDVPSALTQYTIDDESLALMSSPVYNFLGWQASREDEDTPIQNRRIFNAALIKEAILYMTKQLAAVRVAKESGQSLEDAIKATSESVALESNSSYIPKNATNDPMLKAQTPEQPAGITKEEIMAKNTEPYSTPASAKLDPITGSFVPPAQQNQEVNSTFSNPFGGNNTPFQQPAFANFGNPTPKNDGPEGDLPL